jgi:PAS domain S-box-containing protein
MTAKDDEEKLLRSVSLQNTQSILLARPLEEEALQKQSEWLHITLASIGDGVINTDPEGRVRFMNGIAETLTGWTQAEAIGRPLSEIFHIIDEQTRQPIENPALRSLREGTILGLVNDTALIARDGTERPIDDTAAPMRDEAGNLLGSVLIFRDVTERRRAEEVRALLAAIVESSEDAIVSKTLDGVIRSWNAGAARLFGHTAEEAIGQPITLIVPPEYIDEEHSILERLRRGERVEHFETVRVTKDGRRLHVSLTISPLRDSAGRIFGASKVARDITQRKRAEEERKEADRRKDEFLALLAHELRNPLAPLRNGLQVMRLAAHDPKAVAQTREMMERQLGHMVRLIDDLLDVSRISRNKMELRRSRVLLADVISSAVETTRPLIDANGHILTVSIPERPILLDADLTRLSQVFGNLLTNSAKYTERGGRIWLTAEQRGEDVVVSVRDNGIGIPGEFLGTIFDMFSQVNRSLERSTGGLGIGLALVKGLVEMHGGTVKAESGGQGKGSTFTVTLPGVADRYDPAISTASDAGKTPTGPRRRVLIVDDNRDGADSLAMMLSLMNNEVRTANNGVEALKVAEAFQPQLILMDVGMPQLNGYDAARMIREKPWGKSVIIIAVTGWGQEADKVRSQEVGCDGHLVKPVSLGDLEKVLAEFMLRGS